MRFRKFIRLLFAITFLGSVFSCGLPDDPYWFPIELNQGVSKIGDDYYLSVDNNVETFDFNTIIYTNYDWHISRLVSGKNKKTSKVVDLEIGSNLFYVNVQMETKVYYAVYIRRLPIYTVTFDSNGGSPLEPIKIQEGSKIENNLETNRFGYEFVSWKDGDKSWNFETDFVFKDLTLKAEWSNKKYLIVTYNNNGGVGTIDRELLNVYSRTDFINDGANFSKENSYLKEWNTKSDGTGKSYYLGQSVYGETPAEFTLYAIYDVIESKWEGDISIPSAKDGEYYLIRNAKEFAGINELIKNNNSYLKFKLTKDLDLNNIEWEPIGNSDNRFNGEFDGLNHVIRNLKISNYSFENSIEYIGLFGNVDGTISNLSLINSEINVDNSNGNSTIYCRGLIGKLSSTNLDIENTNLFSSTNISVKANKALYVGGLIGYSNSVHDNISINSSHCNGTINITEYGSSLYIGGFIGCNSSYDIIDCYSSSNIYVKSKANDLYVGSLLGFCLRAGAITLQNIVGLGNIEIEKNSEPSSLNIGSLFGSHILLGQYLSKETLVFENAYSLIDQTIKVDGEDLNDNTLNIVFKNGEYRNKEIRTTLEEIRRNISYQIEL